MLILKITDNNGMYGWGEVWCNFPLTGAEHRAKLIDNIFKPLLANFDIITPEKTYEYLVSKTKILSIQSGEPGPVAQCIAGIDIAIHDLIGKIENISLWKKFGGNKNIIPCYASGINPTKPEVTVKDAIKKGYSSFKLKIGFGIKKDLGNIKEIKNILPEKSSLMVDANQAWNLNEAIEACKLLEDLNLCWLEEPIPANSEIKEWIHLKDSTKITLAAGENFNSHREFSSFFQNKVFGYLQPDIAKWGGFTECSKLIKNIIQNKITYCPHYLGGGIGLVASAHLLSASNGKGILEVDINDNPLRSDIVGDIFEKNSGFATLSDIPGLGFEPNLKAISKYLVAH